MLEKIRLDKLFNMKMFITSGRTGVSGSDETARQTGFQAVDPECNGCFHAALKWPVDVFFPACFEE